MSSTGELLAEYAALMNEYGPDADEANAFLGRHQGNSDFVELAEISKLLKQALMNVH
jgi:hypothetical protein